MKTSLKTGFAQIFSCCLPKMVGCRKFGGRRLQPPRSPVPNAPLNETKNDKLFFKQLGSSYLCG